MRLYTFKILFLLLCFLGLLIVLDMIFNPRRDEVNNGKYIGFTTHVHVARKTHLDKARFEKTVDELIANNQKIVRLDIKSWEVAPHGSPTHIEWNYAAVEEYKKALQYAHQKGLSVYLVTYLPSFAQKYSHTDYKTVAHLYYQFLAQEYGKYVMVWQIFNEPDFFRYTDYAPLPIKDALVPWTTEYTENIEDILEIAKNNIKTVSKDALITTNVGGYMNEESLIRWRVFFNATANYMDVIAIDIYPQTLQEVIMIPKVIDELQKTYNKITLKPGDFYLVTTMESVNTPLDITINFKPRSTTFRSGLFLRTGNVAPGYQGKLSFGLKNEGPIPVTIEMGARFVHAQFEQVLGEGNQYRGQWQGGRVTAKKKEVQV